MKTLIIAPHIDDELIGCYPVLRDAKAEDNDITVAWFYELTPERTAEGRALAGHMGFKVLGCDINDSYSPANARVPYDRIYVPSRKDSHTDHKSLNAKYRSVATHFYSVDMVNARVLSSKDQADKKHLLRFYKSQSSLWENDARYYLFDSISETDFDVRRRINFPAWYFSVIVPADSYDAAYSFIRGRLAIFRDLTDLKTFNELVGICGPVGRVTYENLRTCVMYEA